MFLPALGSVGLVGVAAVVDLVLMIRYIYAATKYTTPIIAPETKKN